MAKNNVYDESSIINLGMIEGIRLRPSTFISGVGQVAVLKLIKEVIQNANDEVSSGYANKITVHINSKIPEISVEDNGRGIPIGAIDTIFDNIYSGGKYNDNVYGKHNGSNGMGLCVLRCISDYLNLTIKRDGKICKVRYEDGVKKIHEVKDYNGKDTGTYIKFKPFLKPFFGENLGVPDTGVYVEFDTFDEFMTGLMFTNRGTIIDVTFDGMKKIYCFTGSDKDYIDLLAKRSKTKLFIDSVCSFEAENKATRMWGKSIISFDKEATPKVWSYVEGFPTVENGTHVDGVKAGVTRAIT